MKCQCVGGPYDGAEYDVDAPGLVVPYMPSYAALWGKDETPLIM